MLSTLQPIPPVFTSCMTVAQSYNQSIYTDRSKLAVFRFHQFSMHSCVYVCVSVCLVLSNGITYRFLRPPSSRHTAVYNSSLRAILL